MQNDDNEHCGDELLLLLLLLLLVVVVVVVVDVPASAIDGNVAVHGLLGCAGGAGVRRSGPGGGKVCGALGVGVGCRRVQVRWMILCIFKL